MPKNNVIADNENKLEELDNSELNKIEGGSNLISDVVIPVYREIRRLFD